MPLITHMACPREWKNAHFVASLTRLTLYMRKKEKKQHETSMKVAGEGLVATPVLSQAI